MIEHVLLKSSAVSLLARRVHERAAGTGQQPLPSPNDLTRLYLELLNLLFSGSCCSDAVDATTYVNSQRPWRVRRIGKEIRRLLGTAYPQYNEEAVNAIVRITLLECRNCSYIDMVNYQNVIQRVQRV